MITMAFVLFISSMDFIANRIASKVDSGSGPPPEALRLPTFSLNWGISVVYVPSVNECKIGSSRFSLSLYSINPSRILIPSSCMISENAMTDCLTPSISPAILPVQSMAKKRSSFQFAELFFWDGLAKSVVHGNLVSLGRFVVAGLCVSFGIFQGNPPSPLTRCTQFSSI